MLNVATQRVVALVDMDCFYCQVETRLNPTLKGKPVAVVQYNQWKGGGIIAVNYEARDRGVTRYMRGDEAKEMCPEISLVSVPTIRGKADLSSYRDAGDEVAGIISEFSDCVQRASIDEAYLDLTKAVEEYKKSHKGELNAMDLANTFVVGFCDLKNKSEEHRVRGLTEWLENVESESNRESPDYQLAIGAIIVEKMRSEILKRTGFHCSAGIAHNKILAKLTAGLHKPRRQTVLPQDSVPELYETLPVHKVRNLGGKLGRQVSEKLSVKYMSELFRFSLEDLQRTFDEKTSNWLYNIARGIDVEPVASRLRPESIGCCKNFPGKNALTSRSEVEHWLKELASEISERLFKDSERNKRRAKLLTVSFCQETSMSRCGALNSYEAAKIVNDALELLKKFNSAPADKDLWIPPIKFLGLSASKFTEEIPSVEKYFKYFKEAEVSKKPVESSFYSETQSTSNHSLKSNENGVREGSENGVREGSENGVREGNENGFREGSENGVREGSENGVREGSENGVCEGNEIASSSAGVKSDEDECKNSFFLKYLSRLAKEERDDPPVEEDREDDNEEGEAWISLTEVFPDITEADSEVVESLPEPLRKKFRERLRSVKGDGDGWPGSPETEICQECCKKILKSEALEHSDYHAAVKLHSEINRPASNSIVVSPKKRKKRKENEGLSKRKKKDAVAPSKKMKSLTAFFAPLTKE